MSVCIIYASKGGTTKLCAEKIQEALKAKADIFNVSEKDKIKLELYDIVIFGSPVYAGMLMPDLKKYIADNAGVLKSKKINVFTCGINNDERIHEARVSVLPEELKEQLVLDEGLGGRFIFDRMSSMEAGIVSSMIRSQNGTNNILYNRIDEFAEKIDAMLQAK